MKRSTGKVFRTDWGGFLEWPLIGQEPSEDYTEQHFEGRLDYHGKSKAGMKPGYEITGEGCSGADFHLNEIVTKQPTQWPSSSWEGCLVLIAEVTRPNTQLRTDRYGKETQFLYHFDDSGRAPVFNNTSWTIHQASHEVIPGGAMQDILAAPPRFTRVGLMR